MLLDWSLPHPLSAATATSANPDANAVRRFQFGICNSLPTDVATSMDEGAYSRSTISS
jgi:hypothetical protein